jgi:hypothetical protein
MLKPNKNQSDEAAARCWDISFPTDFAGPTKKALGLIDLPSVAEYERYRSAIANDPEHKKNAARLEESGTVMAMNRSLISACGVSHSSLEDGLRPAVLRARDGTEDGCVTSIGRTRRKNMEAEGYTLEQFGGGHLLGGVFGRLSR